MIQVNIYYTSDLIILYYLFEIGHILFFFYFHLALCTVHTLCIAIYPKLSSVSKETLTFLRIFIVGCCNFDHVCKTRRVTHFAPVLFSGGVTVFLVF